MTEIKKSFKYGNHTVTLETGEIARQATGAVLVRMEDTVVLVTVVGKKEAVPGRDFFPLTVVYQEKTYSSGKIPGGYFKREGRPTERETLTSRLIDRPIRPLFPEGFLNEVQIIATVMSSDPAVSADIPAILGASAALAISGIPFEGPIGAARVGYINNEFVLNSSTQELIDSKLDMVIAGTEAAVLMVESEAKELTEETMLGAVIFGHQQMQTAIKAITEFAEEVGTKRWDWQPAADNHELLSRVNSAAAEKIGAAYLIQDKMQRQDALSAVKTNLLEQLIPADGSESTITAEAVSDAFSGLEKSIVRNRILAGEKRIDGRDTRTVRPIRIKLGKLPRVHGSALFTRGETQAIVAATIGTVKDAQIIDALHGEERDTFMLHYNFPPYCVGETGQMSSPKRREIGHGRLAKRGIQAVLPSMEDFPYVIRVVSEITESNGSSSMASVCGTSLALMDAGVPISSPVAGIAMGLVKEGERFAILTDILGDEDHLGDMDFKVAGTNDGVTALQMDIKINGITAEIMQIALQQARDARLHILGVMAEAIQAPREELSSFAPRIYSFKINPDKIREVIGKGGATIRALTESTGTTIDITDDGTISIAATDEASAFEARRQIEAITADFEVGMLYKGKVTKITDFGAFVALAPGKEGLVHISQICDRRLQSVTEELQEGQEVVVKVIEIDKQGRVRLSMKNLDE